MNAIRHLPTESSEMKPTGPLGIYGFEGGEEGVDSVYLVEPNTVPLKGYEFSLSRGGITQVIEDMYFDNRTRSCVEATGFVTGEYSEIKNWLREAGKESQANGIDLELAIEIARDRERTERTLRIVSDH